MSGRTVALSANLRCSTAWAVSRLWPGAGPDMLMIVTEPPDMFFRRLEDKQHEVDRILAQPTEHPPGLG